MRRRIASLLALIAACSSTTATTLPQRPTTTTAPSTSTTAGELDSREVYLRVAPSLAFVGTDLGAGSGVLVDDRHVVTNFHVVWPAEVAAVRFPNGVEIAEAPVVAIDVMADLAVLDVSAADGLPPPLAPADGVSIEIGSGVYLIGYPVDATDETEPAITAGVLSRRRRWEDARLEYLQTDATIEGGQSGGALVSEQGELVGISGLGLGEGFALSLTAPIVKRRVAEMLAGRDPAGLGDRSVSALRAGVPAASADLPHAFAEAVFVFDGRDGDSVVFRLQPASGVAAALIGPDGYVEGATEEGGPTELAAALVLDGIYFLSVAPLDGDATAIEVKSDIDLFPFADPDHGRTLSVGGDMSGNTDYPGDWDWYELDLAEAETVTIRVTSTNMDAGIIVRAPGDGSADPLATDSDSAGGVLGIDAEGELTAPVAGTYLVIVLDEVQFGPGGYVVTVRAG